MPPAPPDPAAAFLAAARVFLDSAAARYLRGGTQLLADAERAGCRFVVTAEIQNGRVKVELVPRSGERTQLFALQVDAAAPAKAA